MPFAPISTGGRGAGFMLGPEQNVFEGADRAAAATARDNYFTANPANLASYNADNSLNIRLEYADGGNAVAQFQVRNNADNAWLDNDSAIGVRGDDGTATIPGVPDGTIPMVVGGALVASSIAEAAGSVDFAKSAGFPGGSVLVEGFRISNPGGQLLLEDTTTGRTYGIPSRIYSEAGGSGTFSVDSVQPAVTVDFQPRNDETIVASEIGVTITELLSALILQWTSQASPAGSGRFYIRIHLGDSAAGPVIYNSHTPAEIAAGDVFDLNGGNTVHDTRSHPVLMAQGAQYFVRFIGVGGNFTIGGTTTTQEDVDDPTTLFDVVGQQVPAFSTTFQQFNQERVLTEDDLRTDAQVRTLAANMVLNGEHNGLTVARVGDVLNFNVTGITPPVSPDPSVSGLDIGVPTTVPIGFNFNTTRNIRFTTQGTAQITALNLVLSGADDVSLTVPASDGSHTQSITFTGANTGAAGTITAQIRGTTSGGQVIMSNTQTITIQDAEDHEQAYVWTAATQNFADQSLSDPAVLTFDVTQPGTQFSVTDLSVPDGHYINVMYPNNRPVTSIIEPPLNLESLAEFTETADVRTIGVQDFSGRSDQNNAGATVSFSANITVGG